MYRTRREGSTFNRMSAIIFLTVFPPLFNIIPFNYFMVTVIVTIMKLQYLREYRNVLDKFSREVAIPWSHYF